MIDPNSNDLILGSQLSRHSDLLPHLVRSERQGQAVIHHLNPPISPEGKLYTLSPEDQDLKIVFRAMSDGSGFYPYDVYNPQPNSMDSDTLGTTAGEYIVVPLRSTSATPYGFGSQQVFVANVIGSKDDPIPYNYTSWMKVINGVLHLKDYPTCQVQTDSIYVPRATKTGTTLWQIAVTNSTVQTQRNAIKDRDYEKQSKRSLDELDGAHVVLDSVNQSVEAGKDVYMLAIPHWLNVMSFPTDNEPWGTRFAMKTIPNAVGVKLSGYNPNPYPRS